MSTFFNSNNQPSNGFGSQFSSTAGNWFNSFSSTANQYIPVNTSSFAANSSEQEPEWFQLTMFQRWAGFGICALFGSILFILAPLQLGSPSKFSVTFTFGSLLLFTSFAFLKGPKSHFKHVFSKERLPFTLSYFGSMALTLYSSLIVGSTILLLICFIAQVIALIWYFASYLPGGSAAMARTAASLLPR